MKLEYRVKQGDSAAFHNAADYCVGTGRMGLALQEEYMQQLKYVQENIGFSHIRGHGLFCEDVSIYHDFTDREGNRHVEYCFTYLDRIMDRYLELGLRPFLELGFMPKDMASGEQTIFYWKGNVTPPKEYEDWTKLVQTTLRHLIDRYGREEVTAWPIEVWNEPNLPGFWKGADMQEYFKLYQYTATAVKEVDTAFCVGGPAICGVDDERWLRMFLEFVRDNKVPMDFVTRHHYTSYAPKWEGHYGYINLHRPDYAFRVLERSREIVDSFEEFKGMDIHITEFNTSYIPNAPIHDTNLNAAYVAHMLSRLGDCHASYSYWTFGDVFEEHGVAFTPFSGGFGLVSNGGVPKPTFWTFAFFKQLMGDCVHRSDNAVVVKGKDGIYKGCVWNPDGKRTGEELDFAITLPAEKKEYGLLMKLVDEECCNPLKLWHDLGEPATPTKEMFALLKAGAQPQISTRRYEDVSGEVTVELHLKKNAVLYFELRPAAIVSDTGYSYEKALAECVEDPEEE